MDFKRLGLPDLTQKGYVATLDGWRAMAILFVLYEHFIGQSLFNMGRMGVNAFFALSGVLMGYILFVRQTPLKAFYQRRVSRVFPLFWVYILLVYSVGWFHSSPEAGNVLYTLAFMRSYLPGESIWGTDLAIGHLWSLNIEEHAYVIMSLIALWGIHARRQAWSPLLLGSLLVGMGIVSMGVKYLSIKWGVGSASINLQTHANLSFIFIAAGYQVWYQHYQWRLPMITPLVIVALTLGIVSHLYQLHWLVMSVVAPFMFAFAANHFHEITGMIKYIFSHAALRLVGLWSFSLYIWQQPFYLWAKHAGEVWITIVAALFTLTVSLISFYALENPVRHYLNRKWTGRE